MGKFPDDFDGQLLVGRRLEIISFTENTVFFGFDLDFSVTALSSFDFIRPGSSLAEHGTIPIQNSSVMSVLGRIVDVVSIEEQRTVTLHFAGDGALRFSADSDVYESCVLSYGGSEVTA